MFSSGEMLQKTLFNVNPKLDRDWKVREKRSCLSLSVGLYKSLVDSF